MDKNKKIYRDSENRVVGGVCSGLANYLNLDVALVRIAFVIALLFASFGFWLYVILWIVLPVNSQQVNETTRQQETEPTTNSQGSTANSQQPSSSSKTTSVFAGIAVIFIGLIFLVNNFLPISWIWKLWPLILVVIGVVMIINAAKKGDKDE